MICSWHNYGIKFIQRDIRNIFAVQYNQRTGVGYTDRVDYCSSLPTQGRRSQEKLAACGLIEPCEVNQSNTEGKKTRKEIEHRNKKQKCKGRACLVG